MCYPEGMRPYDNDPRSPCYLEDFGICWYCERPFTEDDKIHEVHTGLYGTQQVGDCCIKKFGEDYE